MTHLIEAPYETVDVSILWQMTRFVTIRLAVGDSHVIMRDRQ